jgi:hypothetical protein
MKKGPKALQKIIEIFRFRFVAYIFYPFSLKASNGYGSSRNSDGVGVEV